MVSVSEFRYGQSDDQSADLYLPPSPARGVICLLHGGFWRTPYDRKELGSLAADLSGRGYAIWNMEYRRLGSGGGWPSSFLDVAAGIDHLSSLVKQGIALPLDKVVVAGHSAGGHLALWSAARARFSATAEERVHIHAVVGLAPIADLVAAHEAGLAHDAVAELLAGSPQDVMSRYRTACPRLLLPLRTKQLLIHGANDDVVPAQMSRSYAKAARKAGDDVRLIEVAGAGHMDFLEPQSEANDRFRDWLGTL